MESGRDWKETAQLLFVVLVRATAIAVVGGLLVLSVAEGASPIHDLRGDSRGLAGNDTPKPDCWQPRKTELRFLEKTNLARAKAARAGVRLDPELSQVARKHTRRMVATKTLFHSPRRQLRDRVTRWALLAENVGVGGGASDVHAAFMASHSHRKNILGRSFLHVGIGSVRKAGRAWVTVIFEAKKDPGTTLAMPDC